MAFAEKTMSCSGICVPLPYYMFSDVNNGTPSNGSCFNQFSDFIDTYGMGIYIVCYIVGSILALNFLLGLCLCCHPKQREKGGIYYRMSYHD